MCPQGNKLRPEPVAKEQCMNVNLSAVMQTVTATLTTVGLKVLGAIAIWIIGRWLIGLALQMIGGGPEEAKD